MVQSKCAGHNQDENNDVANPDVATEFDVPVPGIPGIGNFAYFWWYRNRYRKKLVPEKSLGTGIGKIWYRKKVTEPVSEKFGTGKSLGTCIGKIWYWKKSRSWNQYYLIQKKFSTHLAIFYR